MEMFQRGQQNLGIVLGMFIDNNDFKLRIILSRRAGSSSFRRSYSFLALTMIEIPWEETVSVPERFFLPGPGNEYSTRNPVVIRRNNTRQIRHRGVPQKNQPVHNHLTFNGLPASLIQILHLQTKARLTGWRFP
jgi:hypothetical protein